MEAAPGTRRRRTVRSWLARFPNIAGRVRILREMPLMVPASQRPALFNRIGHQLASTGFEDGGCMGVPGPARWKEHRRVNLMMAITPHHDTAQLDHD